MNEPKKPRVQRREPVKPVAEPALDKLGLELTELLTKIVPKSLNSQVHAEIDMVSFVIPPNKLIESCTFMKSTPELSFDYLSCITVVDYEDRSGEFELLYHLVSISNRFKIALKTLIPLQNLTIDTVTGIWRSANWYEREAHDLFGVEFRGHPNLLPLLLYDEFEGFPGRKSFPFHEYDEW